MRRLRRWSVSRRSRARESIAKSTFVRKTHMIWKTFLRVFAERSPTPDFYNELSPSRGPSFHNFDSKLAKLHFWPKRGQWDPIGSQFDPIWIKFDPNLGAIGTQFGPIYIHKLPINRPSGRYVINSSETEAIARYPVMQVNRYNQRNFGFL